MLQGHIPLKEYLDAKARHAEADAAFDRASCRFEELAERMGNDERAYRVAGVALAEYRVLAALMVTEEATERLVRYARTLPVLQRIMVAGAAMCAELPEPAND